MEGFDSLVELAHAEIRRAEQGVHVALGSFIDFPETALRTQTALRRFTVTAAGVMVLGDIVIDIDVHRVDMRPGGEHNGFVDVFRLIQIGEELIGDRQPLRRTLRRGITSGVLTDTGTVRHLSPENGACRQKQK